MNGTSRSGFSFPAVVVAFCGIVMFGLIWYAASRPWSGVNDLSVGQCLARGGVVVDPLGGELRYEQGDFLGNVTGLECPCICLDREGLVRTGGEE
jgi:hypothetical protein